MAELGNPLSIPRALRLFQRRRLPANCLAADVVGNTVYITGDKVGKYYQVSTTDPTDPAKMPAVGIIIQKDSATECIVAPFGEITDIYTGFTPGESLYVGADSRPTHTPPSPGVQQYLGEAWASDVLFLWLGGSGGGGGSGRLYQRPLAGAKNGINVNYTTLEKFEPDSIVVERNGVRQDKGGDYTVAESGGAGTGFDTVVFGPEFPPIDWEKLFADYDPAV
jgi:hypothetical protein